MPTSDAPATELAALLPAPQPPVQHFTLANGLKVYLQEDHRTPLACIQMWYHVGSSHDLPGHTNLAHVLEHMLFEGSDKLAPGQYSRIISRLGGGANASTLEEATTYDVLVPASRVEVVLEIMADTMANAHLDEAAFTKATEAVANERRRKIDNQPLLKAYEHHQYLAHGASPYATPAYGEPLDLQYMKLDTVRTWYRTWYQPNNATLVVVGDIDLPRLQTWVEQHFAHLDAAALATPPAPIPQASFRERREDLAMPGLNHGLIMSFNVPSLVTAPNEHTVPALELALALLTQGPSASLYASLVRNEQVITGINGNYRPELRGDTLLSFYGYSNPGKATVHQASARVWEAIEAFKLQPPPAQALQRAKRGLLAQKITQRNSLLMRANALGYHAALGLPGAPNDDALQSLIKVSAQDVHDAVNAYLHKDRLTTTHLLPPAPQPDTGKPIEPPQALTCPDLVGAMAAVDLSTLDATSRIDSQRFDAPTRNIQAWHTPQGSRVCFCTSPGSSQYRVQLRFQAGACREEQLDGVAALTLYMIDQGAEGQDAKAVAERFASLGATLTREVSLEHATLTLSGLGSEAAREQAIALFTTLVARPDFEASALLSIKNRLLAYVQRRGSSAANQASQLLHQQLFGEHPYSRQITGSAASIENIDPTMLQVFHARCYTAANLDITFIGDLSQEQAAACCERIADALPQAASPLPPIDRPASLTTPQPTNIEQATSNSRLMLALPLGITPSDADYLAIEVALEVLGDGFESRLMRELRDRRSLTYSVDTALKHYRAGSWLQVAWDIEPSYRDAAQALVMLTLQCFVEQGPSQGELELAVNQMGGRLLGDFADDQALATRMAYLNQHGLPAEHYRDSLSKLTQLTPADVQAALQRSIAPSLGLFISIGPQNEQKALPPVGARDQ